MAPSVQCRYVAAAGGPRLRPGNNAAAKAFIEGAACDLLGLAEHHLQGLVCDAEEQRLRRHGWRSLHSWAAAVRSATRHKPMRGGNEARQGTHGGTCWLRRQELNSFPHLADKTGRSIYHDALTDTSVIPPPPEARTCRTALCLLARAACDGFLSRQWPKSGSSNLRGGVIMGKMARVSAA